MTTLMPQPAQVTAETTYTHIQQAELRLPPLETVIAIAMSHHQLLLLTLGLLSPQKDLAA